MLYFQKKKTVCPDEVIEYLKNEKLLFENEPVTSDTTFEPHFINRPNILKFCNLMNSKSVSVLCNMCKYIRIVNMRVCPPG